MGFESLIRMLADGDPASAGVINRPTRAVDQNVRYLWDVLQAAGTGSTVYAHRQTVEESAKVGYAVWLNPSTKRFEAGLAVANVDSVTGVISTSPSSQVWGIVASKLGATLADILLFGYAAIDVSQATGGSVPAGVYYLSSAAPGKLTQQKPPVSVAVLRATGDGRVYVMPQFVDFLDRHTHYRFALTCRPAGTHFPPEPGERHEITDPDETLAGWLPADHEVFGGKAPAGASFGYNLAAQPALAAVWPPLPFGNADLVIDRGLDPLVGGTVVPLGLTGLCVIDRNGLWWLSDCEGDVPWPSTLDTTAVSLSASESDSAGAECPRTLTMTLTLTFAKVNFATDATSVLSLHTADPRIRIRCYGTETNATTGHLDLSLDLDLTVAQNKEGYTALKNFNPATGVFDRGNIAEGIYPVSSNVQVTGDVATDVDVGGTPRRLYQGRVGISVVPSDVAELFPQLVRLDGVDESFLGDNPIMYLGMRDDRLSSYRVKFTVPDDLGVPTPKARLRLLVLGLSAGVLPSLTFSGTIVPRPSDLLTPVDLPADGDAFDITCDTVATLTDTNQFVEALSEPVDVTAGDTVYVSVTRAPDDAYSAQLGVLRQTLVITSE